MEGGERGGEKKKPNKPTRPARRHPSPGRGTPGARTGAARPLHAAGAASPQALSIFRPTRPHAAPASADLQARPAAGSRLGHEGPERVRGEPRQTRPGHGGRPPGPAAARRDRGSARTRPALRPRPLPTRALHFPALTPPRSSAAADEDTNRAQWSTRRCLPRVAAAPLRARPLPQHHAAPRRAAAPSRPAHSAPLPRPASTLPRPPRCAREPFAFRLAARWRVGGTRRGGGRKRARSPPVL